MNTTDVGAASKLQAEVSGSLQGRVKSTQRQNLSLIPEYREVDFTFAELSKWRDVAFGSILPLPNVTFIDLDEVNNRVTVGLEHPGAESSILASLSDRGVPSDAIHFEISGPLTLDLGLRDSVRPLVGGVRIDVGCTFGFNAIWEGIEVWVTASHCSASVFETDGGPFYQSGEFIGDEGLDRSPYECPNDFEFNRDECRMSDSTLIDRADGVPYGFGEVARTQCCGTYGTGGVGSREIDPVNPTFQITAELDFPIAGQIVDQMGQATGWTFGEVTDTCFDALQTGVSAGLFCQYGAVYGNAAGDSGSPVFVWHGSTIELTGIHWGAFPTSGVSLFSALGGVKFDYEYWPVYSFDLSTF